MGLRLTKGDGDAAVGSFNGAGPDDAGLGRGRSLANLRDPI
jgi:hypothetical protein